MTPAIGLVALAGLDALLRAASPGQRLGMLSNIRRATALLDGLGRDESARFRTVLHALEGLIPPAPPSEMPAGAPGSDHDYGDFLKLSRSVRFAWGPWTEPTEAGAFSPVLWALSEILARFGPTDPFSCIEIGAGTGSLGYAVAAARPRADILQTDLSLESLVMACLIQSGERLILPRRVSFDREPDGIGWFAIEVPPPKRPIRHLPVSLPGEAEGADVVAAVNTLSLFPDPLEAARTAMRRVRPGGLFIWLDLLSWRVETPAARRVAGLDAMTDTVRAEGFRLLRKVSGIPYLEDWGFEREYRWTSHAVLAERPG